VEKSSLAVTFPAFYIVSLTENTESPFESAFQRQADLRALQGGAAGRSDSNHLQAQPETQAAAGIRWRESLV
jgi:hypothetical protein